MAKSKTAFEQEIERIEAGGDTSEISEPLDEPVIVGKQGLDVILRLRLTGRQYDELASAARARGEEPEELAYEWVVAQLAARAIKR